MFKNDTEKFRWYAGLTSVEYLKKLWDFAEYDKNYESLISYKFLWLCFNWPIFFPDIMEIYTKITERDQNSVLF